MGLTNKSTYQTGEVMKCPYCESEDIGVIDVLGQSYTYGCRQCGMTGPQANTKEEAKQLWDALCLKLCHHCIRKHLKRFKNA